MLKIKSSFEEDSLALKDLRNQKFKARECKLIAPSTSLKEFESVSLNLLQCFSLKTNSCSKCLKM